VEGIDDRDGLTNFETMCSILAELWANYRQDKELKDFVEYNDLGLPLAFLIDANLVDASPNAKDYVVETWQIFLAALGLENDIEWKSLEQIFKYSENRNKDN
jgi:hypothetical protein